ncbi:MAG: helical backbone metal receptor [Sulfuritalea sp.]|nr:helical backbone metal receptor [Sulfuritalea sp.]
MSFWRVYRRAPISSSPTPAARALPRVGDHANRDLEGIVVLKPDLVMGWQSGNAPAAVARLRAMDLQVHLSEPGRIEDIAGEMERIGRLAGTEAAANAAAAAFRRRCTGLAARKSRRPPVKVFYQIWKQPLMTINSKQIISDAIRLCGGRNVCAQLQGLAPTVSVEAVRAKRGRQAMPLESTGPGGVRGKERK